MSSAIIKPEPGELLKTDKLGRVRTTRKQREAVLNEFDRSALSAKRFTEIHGINYMTFIGWIQKRKAERKKMQDQASTSKFKEVVLAQVGKSSSQPGVLEVELPGGVLLKINSPDQAKIAAELIRALAN